MITQKQIIKKYGGKKVAFKNLPREYQMAMAHYMAIDGSAWELPDDPSPSMRTLNGLKNGRNWMLKNISFWVKKYGNKKFGMMEIPIEDLCKLVFQSMKERGHLDGWDASDSQNFQELHEWYCKEAGGLSKSTDKHYSGSWPVILGCAIDKDYEILQDGWHRFHTYVRLKRKMIPIIYYV